MRMLIGLILGVVLTVGTAWWVDQGAGPSQPRMVNWDIVSQRTQEAQVRLREGWNSLTGHRDGNPNEPVRSGNAS